MFNTTSELIVQIKFSNRQPSVEQAKALPGG